MEIIKMINYVIAIVFTVCYAYQFFYILVPYLKKRKPHRETTFHRYAVLISARNEETVIGQLLDSIRKQDYPEELVTAFVVADNCTDATARIAKEHGAVVYERFNRQQVGKGFALDFLTQQIRRDYPSDAFDAFLVLDADNLLSPNYLTEMNKTFSDGYSIITSYRNSKNYGSNWISAGYALWFLREARYLNESRMLLGTSCAVSGTGFMFSREILERIGDRWSFYLLTEDIEFTIHNVVNGEKIGYCPTAVLYDEQPVTFSQSWKQRMRWAKGYLQVFRRYGAKLIRGTLGKLSFSCFDMCMTIMPAIILTTIAILANLTIVVVGLLTEDNVLIPLESMFEMLRNAYCLMFVIGAVTTISEWKQIHTTTFKKILYAFTFPIFMFTYIPISFVALFKKVEWTPIAHNEAKSIEDMQKEQGIA